MLNGRPYYISQKPWLFSATIRENILFGNEYNKEKFDKIVEACALNKDFELMFGGENSLVGERGVNLSGGQKARISLLDIIALLFLDLFKQLL